MSIFNKENDDDGVVTRHCCSNAYPLENYSNIQGYCFLTFSILFLRFLCVRWWQHVATSWGEWSEWGDCISSTECGVGQRVRHRLCPNVRYCQGIGSTVDYVSCNNTCTGKTVYSLLFFSLIFATCLKQDTTLHVRVIACRECLLRLYGR